MLVFVFCMGLSSSFHPIGFFLALVWVLSVVTTDRFFFFADPQCHFFACVCLGCLLGYSAMGVEGMRVTALDHLVITVRDVDATCAFYRDVLGMQVQAFGDGRLALKFGQQKINIHEAGHEIDPRWIGLRLARLICVCSWRIRWMMWLPRFISIVSTIWVRSNGPARMGPSPRCMSGTPIGT